MIFQFNKGKLFGLGGGFCDVIIMNFFAYIEAYVLAELEVVGVHAEVVHDEGVVHVVGEVGRDGEVTKTHHLLGGVDDDRVVDAGPVRLRVLLQ